MGTFRAPYIGVGEVRLERHPVRPTGRRGRARDAVRVPVAWEAGRGCGLGCCRHDTHSSPALSVPDPFPAAYGRADAGTDAVAAFKLGALPAGATFGGGAGRPHSGRRARGPRRGGSGRRRPRPSALRPWSTPRNVAHMSAANELTAKRAVEDAFRDCRAQVLAALVRRLRDFELAEDALQDAFASALRALAGGRHAAGAGRVVAHCGAQPRPRPAAQPQHGPPGTRSRGGSRRSDRSRAPNFGQPDRRGRRAPEPALRLLSSRACSGRRGSR